MKDPGRRLDLRLPTSCGPRALVRADPRPGGAALRHSLPSSRCRKPSSRIDSRVADAAEEVRRPRTGLVRHRRPRRPGAVPRHRLWRLPRPRRAPRRRHRVLRAPGLPRPGRGPQGDPHLRALADHRPDGPRMARVQLDHSVENPASCRVALAAGLRDRGCPTRLPPPPGPDGPGRSTSPRRVPARRGGSRLTPPCHVPAPPWPVPCAATTRSPPALLRDTLPTARQGRLGACGSHWSPSSSCRRAHPPRTSPAKSRPGSSTPGTTSSSSPGDVGRRRSGAPGCSGRAG